ncbi:MAG: IS982 family transposase [Bacteroidaceae bacterium]|nr:IS982 family transposase [Bacteroidaceae bacterium]
MKHFYKEYVCKYLRHLFPRVVSYNRFVELEQRVAVPLAIFIKKALLGKCTGISFVDSTHLRVYRNQRIHMHKTFKGFAARGKCSMGWFFGFKLHLICNERGELLNFMITPGDVDDRKPLENKHFLEQIFDKLIADKGYISKDLFQRLFVDGIQLITKLKSNMKGAIMSVSDKVLLRKRAIVETINDELKNIAQIEHSRHRCIANFIVNLLSAIATYCFFPKKPTINIVKVADNQITLF